MHTLEKGPCLKKQIGWRSFICIELLQTNVMIICRAGDAILGVCCLIVLMVLQQMKKSIPRTHLMETLPVRISRYIIWTTATGLSVLSSKQLFDFLLLGSIFVRSCHDYGIQAYRLTMQNFI